MTGTGTGTGTQTQMWTTGVTTIALLVLRTGELIKNSPNLQKKKKKKCAEVLPPSQPIKVMTSVVSLPNHIFLGRISPRSN